MIKQCVPLAALTAVGMGTPSIAAGVSMDHAFVLEAVLTFFLMFVIYGTAASKNPTKLAPLFIGLTISIDILLGGPLTGAAMNPARHFGPALLGGGLDNFWLYWVGPIIGAVGAAVLYQSVLDKE